MVIETKLFQENCKKILDAVDSSTLSIINETLELFANGSILYLNVTNKEYYVSVKIPLDTEIQLHAVVNAQLFLSLVSKVTTKMLELTIAGTTLILKANGTYKFPMIFDKDQLIQIPIIKIENITNTFIIKTSILHSILKYNGKELLKTGGMSPLQRLFYIDEQGAITYRNGACVNNFTLDQKVVLLLTEKIVKLFKLFKAESIEFTLGMDPLPSGEFVTKVCFKDDNIMLVAALITDEEFMTKFPVKGVRRWLEEKYIYTITIDRLELLAAINRLALFPKNSTNVNFIPLIFNKDSVTVYDANKENSEIIKYVDICDALASQPYSVAFNTLDLKLTLEVAEGQYISLSFGNHQAVKIERNSVINILPEAKVIST